MQIGIQLYTFRNEKDIFECLEYVKYYGYDFVECAGDDKLVEIINYCKKIDLQLVSGHFGLEWLEENFEFFKSLEDCPFMYVVVPYLGDDYRTIEGYKEVTLRINKLVELYASINIKVLYHNHDFEFSKMENNMTGIDILSDEGTFNFEFDTHWVHTGGFSVESYLESNSKVGEIIHLKDYCIKNNNQQVDGYIGEGNLNFDKILNVLSKKNISYLVVEQENSTDIKTDCLNSYTNISKIISKL